MSPDEGVGRRGRRCGVEVKVESKQWKTTDYVSPTRGAGDGGLWQTGGVGEEGGAGVGEEGGKEGEKVQVKREEG